MFLEYSKSVLDVKHNKIIITSEINRNENQRIWKWICFYSNEIRSI